MRRAPRRHLAQPFAAAVAEGGVGIIEGGPGFGRSDLLREVVAAWPHEAVAWPPDGDDGALRARLDAGARPLLVHADDADRLAPARRAALAALARELPARHRLVLVTHGHCAELRRLGHEVAGPRLGPVRLLLSVDEIQQRLRGLVRDPAEAARAAHAATGGWPEGVQALLAAGWPRRNPLDPDRFAARLVDRRIDEISDREHLALIRATALPRLRETLLRALSLDVDVVQVLLDARVPLYREDRDAWRLPGPLEGLLPKARLEPEDAARVALVAASTDLSDETFQLLWDGGHRAGALDLLDVADGPEAEALLSGWRRPAGLCGPETRAMPVAAERLLRAAERAGHPDRQPFKRQLEALAAGTSPLDERLRAHGARDLLQRGRTGEAREAAAVMLTEARGPASRAIALEVLARAARRRGSADGLATAERLGKEALALWRRLEEPTRVGEARLLLAWVDRDRAEYSRALERTRSVRASASPHGPLWAQAALVEADLLCDTGCCQAAADLLHDLEAHCSMWTGDRIQSRTAVLRARSALHRQRWEEARHWAERVSALPLGWMDGVCGARNLASAADVWSRLDEPERAETCLDLMASLERDPDIELVLARAAVQARIGHAAAILPMLRGLASDELVPPRETWRVLLLAALAATRTRAPDAVALGNAALRAAAATGQPFAPFVREREAAHAVLRVPGSVEEGAG